MKRYLPLFLIVLASTAFGQSNFYRLSTGLNLGTTFSYTDVRKGALSFAGAGSLDYYFTPFFSAGLELQAGVVKSDTLINDPHGRQFTNAFKSAALHTKFRVGQITDFYYNDFLNYTKGFYLGTGIGVISNNMNEIVRYKGTYKFPGEDKSYNAVVPVDIGIDFYLSDGWGDIRYMINLNFQTNFIFGEGLDGYNDPEIKFKNNSPDIYNFFSVGFKYLFGPKGLTPRTIR